MKNNNQKQNKKEKNNYGIILWILLGIFSMVLGWTHILTWVIGTYIWITLVEDKQ